MRKIERQIGENVSPELLQEAKNLRNLATIIEKGNCHAVAYAWVELKDGELEVSSTYNADRSRYTLLGCVQMLLFKLTERIRHVEISE